MAAETITITFSSVIAQCKKLSAFEGRDAVDAAGKSKFESIEITDQEKELLHDYIKQAANAIYERLDRMITGVTQVTTSGSESVTWTLNNENSRWNSNGKVSLSVHIPEAVAAYVMEKWMSNKQSERAPFYQNLYQNTMMLIEQNAYAKSKPARPTYGSNQLPVNPGDLDPNDNDNSDVGDTE